MTDLQKAKEEYYKHLSAYTFGVDSEKPSVDYIKELEKVNDEMLKLLVVFSTTEKHFKSGKHFKDTVDIIESVTGKPIEETIK